MPKRKERKHKIEVECIDDGFNIRDNYCDKIQIIGIIQGALKGISWHRNNLKFKNLKIRRMK